MRTLPRGVFSLTVNWHLDLYVNGVYDLSINQNLLGMPGTDISRIRTVYSHPQAISQCRSYIRKHGFDAVSMANTALAAQKVAQDGDCSAAAIASEETADLYGLQILDHDINESKVNTTRFAVFSRVETKMAIRKDAGAFLSPSRMRPADLPKRSM